MLKSIEKTPVAQSLITKCMKCKTETSHVVVSHNMEGTVEKVKCEACGSDHKYHPLKKKAPKKTVKTVKTAKKTTKQKKPDFSKDFEELTERLGGKTPVPYSMSGSFKADDVIDHQTFGIGFVTSASSQKMEVAFSGGPRLLVCNR